MPASELVDRLLKKKWLSANRVRDGLIACYTLALLDFPQKGTSSVTEEMAYQEALQSSQKSFKALGIGEEYPTKAQLQQVRAATEKDLDFTSLRQENPEAHAEFCVRADQLLEKME